jgi:hypothetical protein
MGRGFFCLQEYARGGVGAARLKVAGATACVDFFEIDKT